MSPIFAAVYVNGAMFFGRHLGSYFADGAPPLNDCVVFLVVGLLAGAFLAAWPGRSARSARAGKCAD